MQKFYSKAHGAAVSVMMRRDFPFPVDVCIKTFPFAEDKDFAELRATELVEHLNEK